MLSSAFLGCLFFSFLFFLSVSLSVLISWRSPARSILFALGQDKHCLCVTPKTFHRLSRFQHGPDISIIGFFLLGVCERERQRERERVRKGKKRKGREKEWATGKRGELGRVIFHFHQDPIKMSQTPTTILSVTVYYLEQKDQHGDPCHTKIG